MQLSQDSVKTLPLLPLCSPFRGQDFLQHGQAILQGRPGVLHVRIEAPLEHRIQRLMDRDETTPTQAELQIEDHDRAARDYVKRYYDLDPHDPMHYHLLINTGLLDLETAAQVIALAVQQMQPVAQPEYEAPAAMPSFYP